MLQRIKKTKLTTATMDPIRVRRTSEISAKSPGLNAGLLCGGEVKGVE